MASNSLPQEAHTALLLTASIASSYRATAERICARDTCGGNEFDASTRLLSSCCKKVKA